MTQNRLKQPQTRMAYRGMETPTGTGGTTADLHLDRSAGRALGRHCPVPLQADPPPPIQHRQARPQWKKFRKNLTHTRKLQS